MKYAIGAGVVVVAAAAGGGYYLTMPKPKPSTSKTVRIGLVTQSLETEYAIEFMNSAQQACSALGASLKVFDYGFSTESLVSGVKSFISSGVDGIIANGGAGGAVLGPVTDACTKNEVYFYGGFTIDPTILPQDVGHYFPYMSYADGTSLYEPSLALFSKLGGKGTVIHIQGTPCPTNSERNKGIVDAWNLFGGEGGDIKLVAHLFGDWGAPGTVPLMETAVASYPNPDGAILQNDAMATGALTVTKQLGLNIPLVGSDGQEPYIKYMNSGEPLVTTTCFHPCWFGGAAVAELYDVITGAYYPTDDERIKTPNYAILSPKPDEVDALLNVKGYKARYPSVNSIEYYSSIYVAKTYPWDWRKMSRGYSAENGLGYDIYGGMSPWGGWIEGTELYGSLDGFRKHMTECVQQDPWSKS